MADDDTVRAVLADREVTFLDPDRGAEIFAERFAQPGSYLVAEGAPDARLTGAGDAAQLALAGEEDWLADHSLAGRPLVPGVRHLQALREAASREGQALEAFHEVRFAEPAWITEPTTLQVDRAGDTWQIVQSDTVHARAEPGIGLGVKAVDPQDPEVPSLDRDAIYERLFHGPTFQPLADARVGDEHVTASARLDTGGAAPWAMAIEAAMQAAGLDGEARQLPVGIAEVDLPTPAPGAEVRVDAHLVHADETGSSWDATVRAGDTPIAHLRGLRLQRTDANQTITSDLVTLGPDDAAISGQPVDVLDPRSPRDKRTAEHRAGNEAADRVLTEAVGTQAQLAREDDRPVVEGAEGYVSITHGHGLALAAAHPNRPIGVDLEAVEARSDAWRQDNLTADERETIAASPLDDVVAETLAWTLKEAAAKAIGTGLSQPATRYEVTGIGDEAAHIDTPEGTFTAQWTRLGDAVVSVAQPEA
jgi:4'-phosphopantetheinyl transferase EntD